METSIIQSSGLSKRYGKFTAVNELSLKVPAGSIYGFVGPNGAGKTTTMRMLTTLARPSAGEAWVAGHSIHDDRREVRRSIGYMPDEFGVYDDLRVWEYLDFFAACYDIPESERRPLVHDLLELVELSHRRDDMVDQLSRGMKQRLSPSPTIPKSSSWMNPLPGSIRVLVSKSANSWSPWPAWARPSSSPPISWPISAKSAATSASSKPVS